MLKEEEKEEEEEEKIDSIDNSRDSQLRVGRYFYISPNTDLPSISPTSVDHTYSLESSPSCL